jgi:hypothetical protein
MNEPIEPLDMSAAGLVTLAARVIQGELRIHPDALASFVSALGLAAERMRQLDDGRSFVSYRQGNGLVVESLSAMVFGDPADQGPPRMEFVTEPPTMPTLVPCPNCGAPKPSADAGCPRCFLFPPQSPKHVAPDAVPLALEPQPPGYAADVLHTDVENGAGDVEIPCAGGCGEVFTCTPAGARTLTERMGERPKCPRCDPGIWAGIDFYAKGTCPGCATLLDCTKAGQCRLDAARNPKDVRARYTGSNSPGTFPGLTSGTDEGQTYGHA